MTTALTVKENDTLERIATELGCDPRLRSHNTRRGDLTDLGAFEVWRVGRPMSSRG